MEPQDDGLTPTSQAAETHFEAGLSKFLRDKSQGDSPYSGTYRKGLKRDVKRFTRWYKQKHDTEPAFSTITPHDFRDYIRDIRDGQAPGMNPSRFHGDTPADGTVITYHANLSAYIGWCVNERDIPLDEHLAQTDEVLELVPDDDGRRSGDQQSWTIGQRDQLLSYLTEESNRIVDEAETGEIPERELLTVRRNHALVATLAYTGIRGAELLREPADDRRTGVRWGDVSLEDNRIVVLAKRGSATWSDRAIPDQAIGPLERYRSLLDPPSDDWPVFPSFHIPSIYGELPEAGVEDPAELGAGPLDLCRVHEVVPPALSVSGAENLLKQLTAAAGIDVDDRHGYLTLHGARRHAGEQMVRHKGFAAAARLLDDTERMVRERYSHIEAKEFAKEATEAFRR